MLTHVSHANKAHWGLACMHQCINVRASVYSISLGNRMREKEGWREDQEVLEQRDAVFQWTVEVKGRQGKRKRETISTALTHSPAQSLAFLYPFLRILTSTLCINASTLGMYRQCRLE